MFHLESPSPSIATARTNLHGCLSRSHGSRGEHVSLGDGGSAPGGLLEVKGFGLWGFGVVWLLGFRVQEACNL